MFICFRNLGAINVLLFMFNLVSTSPYCIHILIMHILALPLCSNYDLKSCIYHGFNSRWSRESWTKIQKRAVKKWSDKANEQPDERVSAGHFLVTNLSLTWGLGTSKKPQNLYYLVNFICFPWLVIQKKELQMMEPFNRADAGT